MVILSVISCGIKGLFVPFLLSYCQECLCVFPRIARITHKHSGLDLILGHLRTHKEYDDSIPFNEPIYYPTYSGGLPVPVSSEFVPVMFHDEPLKGWYRRSGSEYSDYSIVAKIQRFKAGGYEATLQWIDFNKMARLIDMPRVTGKRVQREQNQNDIARSTQRAKKTLRLKIKNMGGDRLLTLTRREKNISEFWTIDQWSQAWKKFCRLVKRAGVEFDYVAVLEQHKKGNYHLHVVINKHVPINVMRGCWWVCCGGRGLGNVDVSYKKHLTDFQRRAGCARYVSKYLSKQVKMAQFFNKKRYWSSKGALPPVKRYVLDAKWIRDALLEFAGIMGLDTFVIQKMTSESIEKKKSGVFVFPNMSGAWLNYQDVMAAACPF